MRFELTTPTLAKPWSMRNCNKISTFRARIVVYHRVPKRKIAFQRRYSSSIRVPTGLGLIGGESALPPRFWRWGFILSF